MQLSEEQKISMPGDIDLDYSAKNVILTRITKQQNPDEGSLSFKLEFEEGEGFEATFLADSGIENIDRIDDLKLTLGFANIPKFVFEEMSWIDDIQFSLDGWVTARTPLQLVSSPGGTYTLWETSERWFPLPRYSQHEN